MAKKTKKRRKDKSSIISILKSSWRINTLFLIFTIVAVGLLLRLYQLQVIDGKYYSALARGQGVDLENTIQRGEVYFQDNAGETTYIAATNKELFIIYADPKEIFDEGTVLEKISEIADIKEEEKQKIFTRLENKDSSFVLIVNNITEEQVKQIKSLNIDGIYSRVESVRYYPAGLVGAHILGFLGFSGYERAGQYGVEEYYNGILSGEETNDSILGGLFSFKTEDSADVELTIDYGIQFVIEKKLEELKENLDAESATAIFMNPKTGAILAMANAPDFNPNTYNEVEDIQVFNNNAVQSLYELGSVFKPITIAAGIDAGVITPQSVYNDTGSVVLGGYTIRNSDGKANEIQTMTEVLDKSLNTGVVYVQQELGKKKFKEYMEAFQLDKKTGIDLPGEIPGNIQNVQNTNRDINFATASFGQGTSFSPIRFLTSISAIANEGVIMRPYIVKKIITESGEKEIEPEEMARPISSITASRVTAMMVSVVENGFGSKAKVPGYTLAGKTGTAQVPNEDRPGYSEKTIHSFVGFAPAYDPKFIGIVTVKNPQGIKFSSDSIAPTFGDMASFILQYYKIPPQ